jgi:phosphoglycerate dehydrogenase-like enzyme
MQTKLNLYIRFLSLKPEQTAALETLGITVQKKMDETTNAVFSDQFFIEQNIETLPKLDYLQLAISGSDKIPLNHPKLINTTISGSRGVFNQPMTEYVIGQLLSIYHNHRFFDQTQKDAQWRPSRHNEELSGKKVAIIGLGHIGLHLAKTLSTLGCYVMGFNRSKKESIYVKEQYALNQLTEQLHQADIVVITLALNDATQGLMNETVLRVLNKNAVLINISRAEIIDEASFLSMMKEGRIRHAVLDTFWKEPVPKESELWSIKNLTVTPHISYTSIRNLDRMFDALYKNLSLYLDGLPLINQLKGSNK